MSESRRKSSRLKRITSSEEKLIWNENRISSSTRRNQFIPSPSQKMGTQNLEKKLNRKCARNAFKTTAKGLDKASYNIKKNKLMGTSNKSSSLDQSNLSSSKKATPRRRRGSGQICRIIQRSTTTHLDSKFPKILVPRLEETSSVKLLNKQDLMLIKVKGRQDLQEEKGNKGLGPIHMDIVPRPDQIGIQNPEKKTNLKCARNSGQRLGEIREKQKDAQVSRAEDLNILTIRGSKGMKRAKRNNHLAKKKIMVILVQRLEETSAVKLLNKEDLKLVKVPRQIDMDIGVPPGKKLPVSTVTKDEEDSQPCIIGNLCSIL